MYNSNRMYNSNKMYNYNKMTILVLENMVFLL